MYFKIQVVIDAADPAKLADFWAFALDYVLEPPPHGFETWEDFGRSIGMPEEEFGDQAAVIDPADEGPRLYFQRVPERKIVKNRVHLDVRVAGREVGGEERKQSGQREGRATGAGGRQHRLGERGRAGPLDRAARPGGQRVLRGLSGLPACGAARIRVSPGAAYSRSWDGRARARSELPGAPGFPGRACDR